MTQDLLLGWWVVGWCITGIITNIVIATITAIVTIAASQQSHFDYHLQITQSYA